MEEEGVVLCRRWGGEGRWYVDRRGSVLLNFNSGLLVVGRRERVLGEGIVAVWVRTERWRVRRERYDRKGFIVVDCDGTR